MSKQPVAMSVPSPHPISGPIAEPVEFVITEEPFEPAGLIVSIAGELDIATVPKLRRRLVAALDRGVRRLVIDLRTLDFLDSVAVATLLHAARQLGDDGRLAVTVAPDSYIRMVFEIAGLPQCLDVVDTRAQAIARISG
jgi:anti-sigma B factor antagonist